jgi:hypothetical protein
MSGLLLERLQFISGLDPVADALSGTAASDVIDMSAFNRIVFLIHQGVGTTGTSTITVEACSDTAAGAVTAIPFHYRIDHAGDEGAIAAATASGFATTAGSSKIVAVEVREDALAATDYRYIRLKAVEVANDPVLAGILVIGEAKVAAAQKPSAID